MKAEDLKLIVQEKYAEIAEQSKIQNQSSCCGTGGCCDNMDYTIFSEDYTQTKGYNSGADLALGCGIPTQFAGIEKGHHVLDLGSGAGNDCFVARSMVGSEGFVTGIDFTDAMLAKANNNLKKTGFENISFVKGDIEEMPLKNNTFNIVLSNCVLNLVPDKTKAFSEIFRVLQTNGHFCISDVVLKGVLPKKLKNAAEMYAGCVSGAIQMEDYLKIIANQGFIDIQILKEKAINIPEEILLNYLTKTELHKMQSDGIGIYSITVTGKKPPLS